MKQNLDCNLRRNWTKPFCARQFTFKSPKLLARSCYCTGPSEKLKVKQPIFDRATLSDNNKRDFATKEDLIDRNRYFLFYRLYLIILLISLIINESGFFLSRNVHIRNIFCKIWVFVFEISSFSLSGCFPYLLVRWHVTSKAQLSTYIL